MGTPYHIRYLQRKEIDTVKWDHCIDLSPTSMIYGRSFYLDFMTARGWDALILDDYQAVMPLCKKKKWGISYLYQPPFTQQLGIFANESLFMEPQANSDENPFPSPILPTALIEAFLFAADRHFRFSEIFLNHGNAYSPLQPRINLILDLSAPYEELEAHYKNDLRKNLKAAGRSPFLYKKDLDCRQALTLFKTLYGHRTPHVKEESYLRFGELCLFLQSRDQLLVRAVSGPENEILASALLPRDENRMYLVQSTVLPSGRSKEANHFLLDNLIREFAGKCIILDFEGSEIPGIAHFYRNFGSKDQPYFFYRNNSLPWPLALFKN